LQISRLTTLERDAARLSGERAQYIASRAQAKGKITETELQIIQVDKDMVSEVSKDLRETNDKTGEFVERKVTAEDQLRRIDIRAPQDGMVLQSTVHTVGGVITAGDAIMMIVPQADDLSVEAKVNPQDIDKLQIGQKTLLRLSAFNQRTTPELNGVVTRVSADVTTDQRTGQSYYTIRVSMPPEEVARLGDVKIIPGMPVEAFVQTGDRTMLSYLMKPLSDQVMRSFRENKPASRRVLWPSPKALMVRQSRRTASLKNRARRCRDERAGNAMNPDGALSDKRPRHGTRADKDRLDRAHRRTDLVGRRFGGRAIFQPRSAGVGLRHRGSCPEHAGRARRGPAP